jgi:hypothetical protein
MANIYGTTGGGRLIGSTYADRISTYGGSD